jgi:sec-independent protein translocase protein TatB
MFDIGLGEILALAVIGLLVFGPDRLPKAAADAGKWVRHLRTMAANAKQDLADSAGVDLNETLDTVRSLGDLHPRKLATNMLRDDDPPPRPKGPPVIDPDAT